MQRFNQDSLALDYVGNQVAFYKQDTLVQFSSKNVQDILDNGAYLISMHEFSKYFLLGFSSGHIMVSKKDSFEHKQVIDLSDHQPSVMKSFRLNQIDYVLVGSGDGVLVVLRPSQND
jgi:hypothetical protein